MFHRILRRSRIAVFSLVASSLGACGGGEEGNDLTVARYAVFKHDNGQPFSLYDAGAVTNPTSAGRRLSLETGRDTDLTGAASSTRPSFRVFSRLSGGVLMLCERATSSGRYAGVAAALTDGSVASTPVYDAAELEGKTFYEVTDCAYRSGSRAQQQDLEHDALTNRLSVSAQGEVAVSGREPTPSRIDAEDFSAMLHGVWFEGSRYSAFKLNIEGVTRYVLIERMSPDELDRSAGVVTIWLPE